MSALLGRVMTGVTSTLGKLVLALLALAVAVYAGHRFWPEDLQEAKPDTPPPEYLYLDSERVLAYLGQIEGGLTDSEKRTESKTVSLEASLDPGLLADVKGSREQARSIEQVVTPKATDRFFKLLFELRRGVDQEGEPWLREINARLAAPASKSRGNTVEMIRKTIRELEEGHFVRIRNAQLFLAPYAAVVPRARYAAAYLGGEIKPPKRPLFAPISRKEQRDLDAYLLKLGADPTLPFVVPTLNAERSQEQVLTFFVPARYTALGDNARLLAGNLQIVGKVVYKDPRLPGDKSCPPADDLHRTPCRYFDRQTLTTYAPALQKAPNSVLRNLGFPRKTIERKIRQSVSFSVPLVVVLPVAIYQ